ncbi:TIGR01841 family phasin [Yunchengibacter salinarum]|uniref:TIGR01841 family phasin n=1 Tax=Yunchengibacter salinarum TaxID=3133399 RepID=UPI0035B64F11
MTTTSTKSTKSTATDNATKVADDMKKNFEAFSEFFSAPSFDASTMFDFGRKNMEASAEASRLAFEGIKTVAQKQVDLAKDNMSQFSEDASSVFSTKTPEDGINETFKKSQDLFKKNLKALREANDAAVDANQKAVSVLQKRYSECVEDLKSAAK